MFYEIFEMFVDLIRFETILPSCFIKVVRLGEKKKTPSKTLKSPNWKLRSSVFFFAGRIHRTRRWGSRNGVVRPRRRRRLIQSAGRRRHEWSSNEVAPSASNLRRRNPSRQPRLPSRNRLVRRLRERLRCFPSRWLFMNPQPVTKTETGRKKKQPESCSSKINPKSKSTKLEI